MKAMIAVMIVLSLTGCTARMQMYAGQGLDILTTQYILQDGGSESNVMASDVQDVLIMKALLIGILELTAWIMPEEKNTIYHIGAVTGYGASAWNGYQIYKH